MTRPTAERRSRWSGLQAVPAAANPARTAAPAQAGRLGRSCPRTHAEEESQARLDTKQPIRVDRQRIGFLVAQPRHARNWRSWSLALVVIGGIIAYLVWPPSAEYLYRHAEALMASESRADWDRALEEYIDPLDNRFTQIILTATRPATGATRSC